MATPTNVNIDRMRGRQEPGPGEGDTTTSYTELRPYLIGRLSELGEVEVQNHLGPSYLKAKITFPEPPVVRNTDTDGRVEGGLWINSDAGGCSPSGVTCSKLPKPGARDAEFHFDLSLTTMWVPLEEHSARLVANKIDQFVDAAKAGFSYRFKD